MTAKELFRKFSSEQKDNLSFSMQFNWWNEVVRDDWNVAVVSNREQVLAVWPYYLRKRGFWKMISQAYLTPYTGPFMIYPKEQKPSSKLSYENKLHRQLIKQLPKVAEIDIGFPLAFSNGLEFLWHGFTERKKYTYLLNLTSAEDELWSNLRENIRRQIRKAEKSIIVEKKFDALVLEQMVKESFESQVADYPLPDNGLIERLVKYVEKYHSGQVYLAKENENIHAALGVVYDSRSAYYLIGGSAQSHKNSGAMSLLMWEAIKDAKEKNLQIFNFEGSSLPSIEKYLRGFGGELTPFCRMTKRDSKSLGVVRRLRK